MANILSLAMKVSADASGVIKNLTPAERALENLGKQAEKTTAVFNKFAKDNEAAAAAQATLNEKFSALAKQLEGGLNAQAYTDQYAALQEEVRQTAAAFEEGIATTRSLRTEQEIHSDEMERLNRLLRIGAIDEQTYARGVAQADAALAKATKSADTFADETARAAKEGLKFNEISGILSALPGPLGNIAGRLSGIASASEGLSRVFSGGLSTGINNLGTQLSSLVTPLNLGVAAFAAFGAAATAITRELVDLEGRVEQLGNTALRLGTDFQTIQVLDEAARRSGVSIDALAAGIQKLAVNINEARSGTGKAADAFRELGITQEELLTLDPASLAEKTAAALQLIEDPARRAALATETLGKAGLSLLPGFNAIGESEAALKRFAAAISDVDQERISSLGQSFDNVKTSLSGLGQNILLPFAGVVEGASNLAADSIGTVSRVAQATGAVLTPVLDTAGKGLSVLGDGLAYVNGVFDSFFGSTEKAAANVNAFRAEVELDTKALEELQRAIENGNKSLDGAINKAAEFGQEGFNAAFQFQEALSDLQDQADSGELNAEQYARGVANATAEYERQIEVIRKVTEETRKASEESVRVAEQTAKRLADEAKRAADEAQRKAEADNKRLQTLLQQDDGTIQLQEDIAFVLEQQLALEQQIATARENADIAAEEAAVARLAEVDQLQAKLEEQQQALEQGFGQGFEAAFTAVDENINGLITKSQEFGQAGFDAALRLQEGIAAAQEQAQAGILNKEAFDAEVQRQQDLFNNEIRNIEEAEKVREKAAQDRVAMEKQQQDEAIRAQQDAYNQQQKAAETAATEQRRVQEEVYKYQQKILEEQQKAAAAEAKRQEERLAKLNTLGDQTIGVQDVRTTQGANLVLDLAANAQDPALIQQRLQTKLLERIALGVGQAASNYFNQPVAIVGAARFN
jgi:hypothetical protein